MLLFAFLFASSAVGAIAVSPDRLSFEFKEGEQQQRQLTVFNTANMGISYSIRHDGLLGLSQQSGMLGPEEWQRIMVTAQGLKPGRYVSELAVSSVSGGGIGIESGVTIKATVAVNQGNPYSAVIGPLLTAAIIIVGMVGYLMLR